MLQKVEQLMLQIEVITICNTKCNKTCNKKGDFFDLIDSKSIN
jgi:hypothetical protein